MELHGALRHVGQGRQGRHLPGQQSPSGGGGLESPAQGSPAGHHRQGDQALGDRRAESAKSFVVDLGVEAYRISTVSYGEERPLCYESNEECWAKNRRAVFVIN